MEEIQVRNPSKVPAQSARSLLPKCHSGPVPPSPANDDMAQSQRNCPSQRRRDWLIGRFLERTVATGSTDAIGLLNCEYGPEIRSNLGIHIPKRRVPLTLRMILNQSKDESRYPAPLHGIKPYAGEESTLRCALHYTSFVAAAYATEKEMICNVVKDLRPCDIWTIHRSTSVMSPNFFLSNDPLTGALVVSIRGSTTLADALTNVLFKPKFDQELTMSVHSGVLNMATQVVQEIKSDVQRALEDQPNREVVLVGHSLGAATAIVATLLLFGPSSQYYEKLKAGHVRCFAFGPPPVLEDPEVLPECVRSSILTLVNRFDIVPTACPRAISRLLLALNAVNEMPVNMFRRIRGRTSKYQFPDFVEMSLEQESTLKERFGNYKHIGRVVLLQSSDSTGSDVHEVQAFEERCVLTSSMLTDHQMGSYDSRLSELLSASHAEQEYSATQGGCKHCAKCFQVPILCEHAKICNRLGI